VGGFQRRIAPRHDKELPVQYSRPDLTGVGEGSAVGEAFPVFFEGEEHGKYFQDGGRSQGKGGVVLAYDPPVRNPLDRDAD
jgi:hypothetical protein